MRNFAFISRHPATDDQVRLAAEQGIRLISIMDMDGFKVTPDAIQHRVGSPDIEVQGVVVVHAGAAMRLLPHFDVGVFENGNRAEEGQVPTFQAVALHIWQKDEGRQYGFNRGLSWANQEG